MLTASGKEKSCVLTDVHSSWDGKVTEWGLCVMVNRILFCITLSVFLCCSQEPYGSELASIELFFLSSNAFLQAPAQDNNDAGGRVSFNSGFFP